MDKIELVGRVSDKNDLPQNNRLVIAFLKGKEVGRGLTYLGKYEEIDEVPNDGLFSVEIPNSYELSESDLALSEVNYQFGSLGRISSLSDVKLGSRTYIDLNSISEGQSIRLDVRKRDNVNYTVKVLPGEFESLPLEIQDENNSTVLTKDNKVIVVSNKGVPTTEVENVKFYGKSEKVKLKSAEFPINNCSGNSRLKQRYHKTESYLHETNFNLSPQLKSRFPALWLVGIDLSAQLNVEYGFNEKEFSEETIEYEFIAEPRSNVLYTIDWYEIWEHGEAEVQSSDGIISVPFKVRTGLKYEVKTSRSKCG